MLKMADGSSAKSQLVDRLSYRLNQYENYKPEETKKIQAAKIFQAGDYWVLVISDNADEISDEITRHDKLKTRKENDNSEKSTYPCTLSDLPYSGYDRLCKR
mgnify:FL=1